MASFQMCLPALWLLVAQPLGVAAQSLSDTDKVGIITGCIIGGLILIFLLILLVILLCRPRKSGKHRDDDGSSKHSFDASPKGTMEFPMGIWTTKPSMVLEEQNPSPYQTQYRHSPSTKRRQDANKYTQLQNGVRSNPYVPWYQRTVRSARRAFQRIPAYFQIKASSPPKKFPWKAPEVRYRNAPIATGEIKRQISLHADALKSIESTKDEREDVTDSIPTPAETTARVFSDYKPSSEQSRNTTWRSPYVAKVYSDYKTDRGSPKPQAPPPPPPQPSVARAFSSHQSALDRVTDIHMSPSPTQNPSQPPVFSIAFSDLSLYRPVMRSQSNAEKQRETSLQRGGFQEFKMAPGFFAHPLYRRGIVMRSPSDAQNYSLKKENQPGKEVSKLPFSFKKDTKSTETKTLPAPSPSSKVKKVEPQHRHPQQVPNRRPTQPSLKPVVKPQPVPSKRFEQRASVVTLDHRPKPTPVLPAMTNLSAAQRHPIPEPPRGSLVARAYSNPNGDKDASEQPVVHRVAPKRPSTESHTLDHAASDQRKTSKGLLGVPSGDERPSRKRTISTESAFINRASETEHKEPGPSKMRLDAQRMRSSSKVSIMSAETTASHTTANTAEVNELFTFLDNYSLDPQSTPVSQLRNLPNASDIDESDGKLVVGDAFKFLEDFDDNFDTEQETNFHL